MSLFFNTLQIVAGVLLPLFLLLLAKLFIEMYKDFQLDNERKIEQAKKMRPFDHYAEFYKVPNPTMIGVRLFKDDVVVWEGEIDKYGQDV